MAKTNIKNTAPGARGIYTADGQLVMLEPGESRSLDVSASEMKDAKAAGHFKIGGKAAADDDADNGEGGDGGEPGPLDGSIAALSEHIAGVDDADEIQALIDGETAGKSRAGALTALNERLEALQGEGEEEGEDDDG